MKEINYIDIINKCNSYDELNNLKENFLFECDKRKNKISVSNIFNTIDNFGVAKYIFETIAPSLLSKRQGKGIINQYVKIVKENNSIRTLYAYHNGLLQNDTPESKKAYITEALSITKPIDDKEYMNGMRDVIKIISESFKLLGDDIVLSKITNVSEAQNIGNSLLYLSKTKKTIKNLNEYINHIDNVSNIIKEDINNELNIDLSLEEIVSEMKEKVTTKNIDNIFETDDKQKTFTENKQNCLQMLAKKKLNSDEETNNMLSEIENKLSKKQYTFDTFTKDILYMTELQEVLK